MNLKLKRSDALKFIRVAKDRSLDEAVSSFGDAITAGEYMALKQLDADELKALIKINEKINTIRGGGLAADAWTCVNIAC